jgi:hypothetical protein
VFIRGIRGSWTSGQDGIWAAFERSAFWESFSAFRGGIWAMPTEATGVA